MKEEGKSNIELVLQGWIKEKAGRQRKSIIVTEGDAEKKEKDKWVGNERKQKAPAGLELNGKEPL